MYVLCMRGKIKSWKFHNVQSWKSVKCKESLWLEIFHIGKFVELRKFLRFNAFFRFVKWSVLEGIWMFEIFKFGDTIKVTVLAVFICIILNHSLKYLCFSNFSIFCNCEIFDQMGSIQQVSIKYYSIIHKMDDFVLLHKNYSKLFKHAWIWHK